MVRNNTIEVAEAMKLRELANGERSGGKSAESVMRARMTGWGRREYRRHCL